MVCFVAPVERDEVWSAGLRPGVFQAWLCPSRVGEDRKSTRLNSSHGYISYAVFCLKKKNKKTYQNKQLIGPGSSHSLHSAFTRSINSFNHRSTTRNRDGLITVRHINS